LNSYAKSSSPNFLRSLCLSFMSTLKSLGVESSTVTLFMVNPHLLLARSFPLMHVTYAHTLGSHASLTKPHQGLPSRNNSALLPHRKNSHLDVQGLATAPDSITWSLFTYGTDTWQINTFLKTAYAFHHSNARYRGLVLCPTIAIINCFLTVVAKRPERTR
jgi:hypothetical protein